MTIQADSVGRLGRAMILELQYEHPRAVRSVTSRQAVRVRQTPNASAYPTSSPRDEST